MINYEEPSLAEFGIPFQEKLAQLIMVEPTFADQVGEVLKPSFFEAKYLQEFSAIIFEYKSKYKKYPSQDTLTSILKTELKDYNEGVQRQIRDFFAKVVAGNVKNINDEYVKEKSLDFCRKQTLKEAMIKSVKLMEKSSFDEVSSVINNALKLGSNNEQGHNFLEHFEERYKPHFRKPISTGWKVIDEYTQGGIGKGELAVVIAATGGGKSYALVHHGAQALMEGKNVVHYTLELKDTLVGRRYDACLTKIPLDSLNSMKDDVFNEISNIPGKLIIKEYPTKSASTMTIRNHLDKIISRSIQVDMVIIDYADLLRPVNVEREKRNELESIYEQIRGLGAEYDVSIVTASQSNRSGAQADLITMENIAEAYSKCFVADLIYSISRTALDKQNKSARMFIAKNRNGADGLVLPMFFDTATAQMEVHPPLEGSNLEEEKKVVAKEQLAHITKLYKKHRKNGGAAKETSGASIIKIGETSGDSR